MPPANTSENAGPRPRVGIPWRTSAEERQQNREKLNYYFRAVRKAGAEPEEVSLERPREELERQLRELDAFVLPGSPADVDPGLSAVISCTKVPFRWTFRSWQP